MISSEEFDRTIDLPFPKVSILSSSTPIIHLKGIGDAVGHPNLWLKNDGEAGFLTGGSKVRALEYLIGRAINVSASAFRTFGYVDSNFALSAALYCTFYGIQSNVILMQDRSAHGDDSARSLSNLSKLGACTRVVGSTRCILSSLAARYLSPLSNKTFSVPIGGATPFGCIGYIAAVMELRKQIEIGMLPHPSKIIVPVGSGGLLAGLFAGFSLLGDRLSLLGVRVAGQSMPNTVHLLARRTRCLFLKALRQDSSPYKPEPQMHFQDSNSMNVNSRYDTSKAIDLLKSTEGIQLDNKYAGPAMSAFLEVAIEATDKASPLLFWNTCNGRSVEKAINMVVQQRRSCSMSRLPAVKYDAAWEMQGTHR